MNGILGRINEEDEDRQTPMATAKFNGFDY